MACHQVAAPHAAKSIANSVWRVNALLENHRWCTLAVYVPHQFPAQITRRRPGVALWSLTRSSTWRRRCSRVVTTRSGTAALATAKIVMGMRMRNVMDCQRGRSVGACAISFVKKGTKRTVGHPVDPRNLRDDSGRRGISGRVAIAEGLHCVAH